MDELTGFSDSGVFLIYGKCCEFFLGRHKQICIYSSYSSCIQVYLSVPISLLELLMEAQVSDYSQNFGSSRESLQWGPSQHRWQLTKGPSPEILIPICQKLQQKFPEIIYYFYNFGSRTCESWNFLSFLSLVNVLAYWPYITLSSLQGGVP